MSTSQKKPELDKELYTEKELSALLGFSRRTLEGWRHRGFGPAYISLGESNFARVRYPKAAVVEWQKSLRTTVPRAKQNAMEEAERVA